LDQATEFVAFFHGDTVAHFREEEEVVFPLAVGDPRARDLLSRVMIEHLQFHALVSRLEDQIAQGAVDAGSAQQTAEALEKHIRLEEGHVFPLLEEIVSDAELAKVSLATRNRDEPPDAA
jgi:hemerythrin-like domain-containing protein